MKVKKVKYWQVKTAIIDVWDNELMCELMSYMFTSTTVLPVPHPRDPLALQLPRFRVIAASEHGDVVASLYPTTRRRLQVGTSDGCTQTNKYTDVQFEHCDRKIGYHASCFWIEHHLCRNMGWGLLSLLSDGAKTCAPCMVGGGGGYACIAMIFYFQNSLYKCRRDGICLSPHEEAWTQFCYADVDAIVTLWQLHSPK